MYVFYSSVCKLFNANLTMRLFCSFKKSLEKCTSSDISCLCTFRAYLRYHNAYLLMQICATTEKADGGKGETAVKTEEYSATMQQAMGTCN